MDVGLSEVLACPPPAPPTAPASRQSAPQSPLTKPGVWGTHLVHIFLVCSEMTPHCWGERS